MRKRLVVRSPHGEVVLAVEDRDNDGRVLYDLRPDMLLTLPDLHRLVHLLTITLEPGASAQDVATWRTDAAVFGDDAVSGPDDGEPAE